MSRISARIAAAGQVVVDAAQHLAAPALRWAASSSRLSQRADDAVVEGALGVVAHGAGGEAYAL